MRRGILAGALLLACLLSLAGCGGGAAPEREARRAYEAFLAGDLSLFAQEELDRWGLEEWMGLVLVPGEAEYTYLDLDGDGVPELLLQRADDPAGYNGVFRYEDGGLVCWQSDGTEGSCRDYPLEDGTMVRQYDFDGTSYTLFRYRADGEEEIVATLREEPGPSYQIDGEEAEADAFSERLKSLVTDRILGRDRWTVL